MEDDQETLTAYHEAGHAVVAYALGATVESVGLEAEADEWLPARFGDCRVNWGRVSPSGNWQLQREILTLLAGPVAEMIYQSEPRAISEDPTWQYDWRAAESRVSLFAPLPKQRADLLNTIVDDLRIRLAKDPYWAAIAAVADELLAHELLEEEQLADTLSFWIRT